jgi:hypothetical protein
MSDETATATFVLRAARRDAREALESLIDAVWRTRPGPTPTIQLVRDADEGWTFTRAADIDANFEVLTRRLLDLRPDIRVIITPHDPRSAAFAQAYASGHGSVPEPPPVRMWTNRELYDFVAGLPATGRSLEDYLRALSPLLAPHPSGLALEVFADLLAEALTSEPAADPPDEKDEVQGLLWHQIGELPRLRFRERHRDYAAVKGSDSRWYNTSVEGFLTAGAAGAFRGHQAEGEDLEFMPYLTVRELKDFFRSGQWYE